MAFSHTFAMPVLLTSKKYLNFEKKEKIFFISKLIVTIIQEKNLVFFKITFPEVLFQKPFLETFIFINSELMFLVFNIIEETFLVHGLKISTNQI